MMLRAMVRVIRGRCKITSAVLVLLLQPLVPVDHLHGQVVSTQRGTGILAVSGAASVQEFRLPNGLRVLLSENHERPLVRLELRTAWDPAEEPPGKEGLGGFLAELLKTSRAGPLNREAFQLFLEDRALRFSFSMQSRSFAWSVLADSQGQDGAFESLAMAATRPDFDGIALEARRQSYIQAFKERTPRVRAEDRFRRRIGDPSRSMLPEEGSLNRIELQDLVLLSRRVLRPEKSVLVIQGDMNLPQAKQLAMLHLGAWGPSSQERVSPARGQLPEQPPPTRTWVIREAGRAVQIRLGGSLPADKTMPASTLAICTWLAERELASSLPVPLVKAKIHSYPDGAWMIEVDSEKSVPEAMAAVEKLLTRLRGKGGDAGEWIAARKAWNAERKNRALHPQQEAASLADRALRSGGLTEGVDSLKAEDIQTALRQLFSAGACSYFIMGGFPQDVDWLTKAGLGPVELVN